MARLVFMILFVAALATILWGSLTPQPWSPQMDLQREDLVLHLAAYSGASVLGLLAGIPPLRLLALLLALGGGLEFAQGALTAMRTPDPADMIANAVGAAVPVIATIAWRRRPRGTLAGHGAGR